MKVLAPIRSSAEVAPLLAAGAEEFYCGLTPPEWTERFGLAWISRRNPSSSGLPGLSDLRAAVDAAGSAPVYVTLNAAAYPEGAIDFLTGFGRRLIEEGGAAGLIVADLELLLSLAAVGLAGKVHLSSLATCVNSGASAFYRDLGVSRIILPRHVTLSEIEAAMVDGVEFEAFLLNDGCVFEEGLCATTHAAGPFCLGDCAGGQGVDPAVADRYELWKWTLNNCGCRTSNGYQLGPCGLCAMPALAAMGVAAAKVVGREASLERKIGSVRLAALASSLAMAGAGPEEIRAAVVGERDAGSLCDGGLLCYYPDVWTRGRRVSQLKRGEGGHAGIAQSA